MNLPEIRTNQFITGLPIPRMYLCSRPENQIAACIKRTQKAFFVTPQMRFHPLKGVDGDKERIFDRGVISPKTDSLPGSVITSTVVRKFQRHRYPPDLDEQPRFAKPSTNERSNKSR